MAANLAANQAFFEYSGSTENLSDERRSLEPFSMGR